MAGVIGIYGLIVAAMINVNIKSVGYTTYKGLTDLGGGISSGICGLAAGMIFST